ncbi:MAG TPA: phosphotransferase [Bacteroidales bacterium]|nr:phosphotransferase [Bacteroidales bacterium]
MSPNTHVDALTWLYQKVTGTLPGSIAPLPRSGSARVYYRITSDYLTCIGTYNGDVRENETFIYLAKHLSQRNIPVPQILGVSECKKYYLQTDLGSLSLYDIITNPDADAFETEKLLVKVVSDLAKFNMFGFEGINELMLYPIPRFDIKSVMWDLYYFKYCFIKPLGVTFNEAELEKVFDYLSAIVLGGDNRFLQFRDFQSRNVMVTPQGLYYIDFQSARIGSGLYDLASLLYQAKANFSNALRNKLLQLYIDELETNRTAGKANILSLFPYMAIFRILQTLGAYGFRGLMERKAHFIQSIPIAMQNLGNLLESVSDNNLYYLNQLQLELSQLFKVENDEYFNGLTLKVYSFSIKNEYPPLHPEHGGGFVFDCRVLPNPGQLDEYKDLTGLDKPVIDFLNSNSEVKIFCSNVSKLVMDTIDKYLARNFKHLSVGFGCTGGQHRSVFCAEHLVKMLKGSYGDNALKIVVNHIELEKR